jgi:predicted O-linked N-acetylglucosamine transferase (SPINDLY family)
MAHYKSGRPDEAMELFERVRAAAPRNVEVLCCIGTIAQLVGQNERAAGYMRDAIKWNRNVADFHLILGNAELNLNDNEAALRSLRRALKLKPHSAEAHTSLGAALMRQGQNGDALRHLNRALELDPKLATAHMNKGAVLLTLGLVNDALASFRTAIVHNPEITDCYANIVKCLNFLPGATFGLITEASRRWSNLKDRPPRVAFTNDRSPDRKLRVGYVSADFREHAVAHFLETVLAAHNRSAVEVTCYSNNRFEDLTTLRIKATVDRWREIRGMDAKAAAALVRDDAVDILVDLSGHTIGERLDLFVSKPAPVQCTWLGYYATTGLPEIDYIITDRFIAPPGDEAYYAETPWRMPDSYLCFTPPEIAPAVNPLPARRNGYVTFGSCNNILKLNNLVIASWCRLLESVPQSRLLLRHTGLSHAGARDELQRKFDEHGVGADRLSLLPGGPREVFITTYHDFDIALDPYPYGGGTTTAEALWMGLPVVSLRGDRFSGRVSESILATIGMPQLVAESEERYIATACELARDLDRLERLRAELRPMVAASPLCDAPRFAANLENAFRQMWQRWCAAKETAA